MKKKLAWIIWALSSLALSGYLGNELLFEKEKPNFLIGQSTSGHHQIELACSTCHTDPFGGGEVLQNACLNCHEEELTLAQDSHPGKKFNDPRNADLISVLDARQCITCHSEHNPDITRPMGVTMPEDYCVQCHQDIATERPSHDGMGFETCASSGCHNYHDNRALYEDFLLKHGHGELQTPIKSASTDEYLLAEFLHDQGITWQDDKKILEKNSAIVLPEDTEITNLWHNSPHQLNGIGCLTCHTRNSNELKTGTKNELTITNKNINKKIFFNEKPGIDACSQCHQSEAKGFLEGKHGMRLAQQLQPMSPAMARANMQPNAHQELSCASCHNPHSLDLQPAKVDACLGCHADDHSTAFLASPHGKLWLSNAEIEVTCATCHMPKVSTEINGKRHISVEHNQNATLRPSEKMIRSSCLNCHTLQFSLDALADETLIKNNFNGKPTTNILSIEMAKEREQQKNP
ncbi:MAG: cytochrome c3 family protein [Cellvibrionales bacterium]|nr:cytochrome c3 family protein [Cellvibrionales bacterium]